MREGGRTQPFVTSSFITSSSNTESSKLIEFFDNTLRFLFLAGSVVFDVGAAVVLRTDFVVFVGFLAVITVGPFVFFTEGDFVAFTFTFETLSRVLRAFQEALMLVFLGVEVLVAVRGGSLEKRIGKEFPNIG